MPTSLTGLLIFIALLAPGFAFLLAHERGPRVAVERSVLRETAAVVLASLCFDAVALTFFGIVQQALPGQTPDPGQLVSDGWNYSAHDATR